MQIAASLAIATIVTACERTPVVRHGPPARRIVTRTWGISPAALRSAVLETFSKRAGIPAPFDHLTIHELAPPAYAPDWVATLVDPGDYLADYKQLSPALKRDDLLL